MRRMYYLILWLSIALFSCDVQRKQAVQSGVKESLSDIKATIFMNEDGSYGYDIHMNRILIIHQPYIPARAGNIGFPSQESACKIADLVIGKIKNKEMPPAVSADELRLMAE